MFSNDLDCVDSRGLLIYLINAEIITAVKI